MQPPAPLIASRLPPQWRARLRQGLLSAPDHRLETCRLGGVAYPSPEARIHIKESWPQSLRPAAVLVPIVDLPDAPTLLMTVRASHLRQHAGQISFPGGSIETSDVDVTAGAIRETHEEIGIDAHFITPIGFLQDHVVQSGFRITPVVALVQPGFTLNADSTEVADVFELPLDLALAIESYRAQQQMVRELKVDVWELPFGEYHIWGATAGILVSLCEVVSGAHA
jgi:8-oxo-dGTP pyrophosphatase MutT (NUDIX family)